MTVDIQAISSPGGARLTSLLSNDALSRLEQLRIRVMRRFTNHRQGEFLSGRGGTSTEFSDYRDYVPGDDTRFVDWNIFARLHRPYLKLYRHEEDMHVVIFVDASSSMLFEGKLERAKTLAAAFGVMGLLNIQRVSVYAVNRSKKGPEKLRPCSGRASLRTLFSFLEGIDGGGDAPVEEGIDEMLKTHSGRGVGVILSDFLTFGDLKKPFNRLFSAGLETLGIQILGPSEADPEVSGDVRFVDVESRETLDVSSAGDLLALYREHLEGFRANLEGLCRQRAGRFLSILSADPLEGVLFDLLRRKGWVE